MSASLRLPLQLSIAAALLTLGLKGLAWWLTGSVSLLSDALESIINLAAAVAAYAAVWYAARPADASHPFGHEKIEYFSSGLEGGLILVAAGGIAWTAVERLIHPRPLEGLTLGLGLSLLAACINGLVAWMLLHVGRKHGSIVLEADGQHLMTDVWTSAGVLAGLGLVAWTGQYWLDPVLALLVAANILWTGASLVWRSFKGLMDAALPEEELEAIRTAVRAQLEPGMDFHALRTRQAGRRRFADFHLLVPGRMTVQSAHDLMNRIEKAVEEALPGLEVTVHVEPAESHEAWHDSPLLDMEQAARIERGEAPMPRLPASGP
jgi:cation diffusion facilitator family transporter